MSEPAVKVTLDVTCDSETVVEKWCSDFLKHRGYHVAVPHAKWERLPDFLSRVGISHMTLSRKRKAPDCPNVQLQYSQARNSKGKRILAILSNPAFDAYCVANK